MNSEKSLDKEISLRMPQMCSQNAANAISAIQFLNIFRGSMPPDPPRCLVPSAFAPPPLNFTKFPPLGVDMNRGYSQPGLQQLLPKSF